MSSVRKQQVGEDANPPLKIYRLHEPDLHLAQTAQVIGLQAWTDRLAPRRTESDVRHTFNPDRIENAERLLERMRDNAGKFVGVVAALNEVTVGYAWAAADQSAGRAKLLAKKMARKNTAPWAWVAQINTLPEYQGQGIGSVMLDAVTGPFDPSNRRVAYVFDENTEAMKWFYKRGFNRPRPKEPTSVDRYFPPGPDGVVDPVDQWRLEAPYGTMGISISQSTPPEFAIIDIPVLGANPAS